MHAGCWPEKGRGDVDSDQEEIKGSVGPIRCGYLLVLRDRSGGSSVRHSKLREEELEGKPATLGHGRLNQWEGEPAAGAAKKQEGRAGSGRRLSSRQP